MQCYEDKTRLEWANTNKRHHYWADSGIIFGYWALVAAADNEPLVTSYWRRKKDFSGVIGISDVKACIVLIVIVMQRVLPSTSSPIPEHSHAARSSRSSPFTVRAGDVHP